MSKPLTGLQVLNLTNGSKIKFIGNDDELFVGQIRYGAILTRKHNRLDDPSCCAFEHPDLEGGYDFFFPEELELFEEEE